MAVIKNGYGSKKTQIRIGFSTENGGGKAEVWIEQEGVPRFVASQLGGAYHPSDNAYEKIDSHSETLAYAELTELIELRDELNEVIKKMAGV